MSMSSDLVMPVRRRWECCRTFPKPSRPGIPGPRLVAPMIGGEADAFRFGHRFRSLALVHLLAKQRAQRGRAGMRRGLVLLDRLLLLGFVLGADRELQR